MYNQTIPAGAKLSPVQVEAKIRESVTTTTPIRNVVGVCISDPTKPANDPAQCTPDVTKCEPGHLKYDVNTKTCDPAHVVPENVDLSIKKYVDNDTQDAQPNAPVQKDHNSTFNYVIRVKVKSGKATGTTTVKDVLPVNIQLNGTPTGANWNFSKTIGNTIVAESTQEVTAGNYFADIIIPVKLVNTQGEQIIRNDASVHNPNEIDKPCHPGNTMITGTEKFDSTAEGCKVDTENTDPAVVRTPKPSTPPPPPTPEPTPKNYNAVMCDGQVAVVRSYSNEASCKDALNRISDTNKKSPRCYMEGEVSMQTLYNDATRMTALYCATQPVTPYCGNGILEEGEMCDPGTGKTSDSNKAQRDGATCSASCDIKITPTTNPGENVIDFYITIPGFAKTL